MDKSSVHETNDEVECGRRGNTTANGGPWGRRRAGHPQLPGGFTHLVLPLAGGHISVAIEFGAARLTRDDARVDPRLRGP